MDTVCCPFREAHRPLTQAQQTFCKEPEVFSSLQAPCVLTTRRGGPVLKQPQRRCASLGGLRDDEPESQKQVARAAWALKAQASVILFFAKRGTFHF